MLPGVVGEGAGVDLLHVEIALAADALRGQVGPAEQDLGDRVSGLAVEQRVDHDDEEHPAGGAVVGAGPAAQRALARRAG